MAEETPKLLDIASFFYGVISLCGIGITLYLSWRTLQRQEDAHKLGAATLEQQKKALELGIEAYKREEAHSAVLTSESLQSFNKLIDFCVPVSLQLRNCSRFPTVLKVDVYAHGFSVHYDDGDSHPSTAFNRLRRDEFVVVPGESYTRTFRIHLLTDRPSQASVTIYLNDKYFYEFLYVYSYQVEYYELV
jgi:hypothetical protein